MRRTDRGRMPSLWTWITATGLAMVLGGGVLAQDLETRNYLPFALWGERTTGPAQATPTAQPTTPAPASPTLPSGSATGDPTAPSFTPTPEATMPPETEAASPIVVVPRDIDPDEWSNDAVVILDAGIEDDLLELEVRYGGGCLEHDLWLAASSFFMESQPPQVALMLSHDGHGDLCRALIFRTLRFDLSPLRRTFLEGGDPEGHGTLLLRLRDHAELIRYDF